MPMSNLVPCMSDSPDMPQFPWNSPPGGEPLMSSHAVLTGRGLTFKNTPVAFWKRSGQELTFEHSPGSTTVPQRSPPEDGQLGPDPVRLVPQTLRGPKLSTPKQ